MALKITSAHCTYFCKLPLTSSLTKLCQSCLTGLPSWIQSSDSQAIFFFVFWCPSFNPSFEYPFTDVVTWVIHSVSDKNLTLCYSIPKKVSLIQILLLRGKFPFWQGNLTFGRAIQRIHILWVTLKSDLRILNDATLKYG